MNRVAALYLFSVGLALAPASAARGLQLAGLNQTILDQRASISAQPGDSSLWNDLGNLLVLARKGDEAQSAYRQAIDIDPANADAHFNLALALQQAGQIEEALSHYHSTLEIDSEHGWALYQIGAILEAQKKRDEAIDYYARAFDFDPDLLFLEVNPHIVRNELILESLLRKVDTDPRDFSLPRIYAHRDQIVEALVPPVPEESAKAVNETEAATEEKPAHQEAIIETEIAIEEKPADDKDEDKQLQQQKRRRRKNNPRPPAD